MRVQEQESSKLGAYTVYTDLLQRTVRRLTPCYKSFHQLSEFLRIKGHLTSSGGYEWCGHPLAVAVSDDYNSHKRLMTGYDLRGAESRC